MQGVSVCVDNKTNVLVGMQAILGVYSNKDLSLLQTIRMNKIGTVTKAKCDTISVNPFYGEYITNVTFRYGDTHIT
jgi:hypothetical protein